MPDISEYSTLLGYTNTARLNSLYNSVRALSTDDINIHGDTGLCYHYKSYASDDMIYDTIRAVYVYVPCSGGNYRQWDDRLDILEEEGGLRKLLLSGTCLSENITLEGAKYRKVLYP